MKNKKFKTALIVILAVLAFGFVLFALYWNGYFNRLFPKEVATVESPDGQYVLVYQQLGDPDWPYGATDVRLVLKDRNGKKLATVSLSIADDGSAASEQNIKSVEWKENEVVVVLQASEMADKEVVIRY